MENYHKLAFEKDDELIVLLGRMGAKTVKIHETGSSGMSGKGSLNADNLLRGFDVNAKFSKEDEHSKELIVTFEGNVTDIPKNLLEQSLWFKDDSKVNSILESRRFLDNKVKKYSLKNTYTESFDFDFDLAAKFLIVKVDLKAKYESLKKKERNFLIEFG